MYTAAFWRRFTGRSRDLQRTNTFFLIDTIARADYHLNNSLYLKGNSYILSGNTNYIKIGDPADEKIWNIE